MVGQLGDVHKTVLTGSQLHEGTEGHQAHHAAVVQLAHLGDEHDVIDALLGGITGGGIRRGDVDGAVIVNVDLGAGIGHDLLDDGAALADDVPDVVGIDVHDDHLGCVAADLLAGLGDDRQHDLVENLAAGIIGDVQRVLDDLHGQTVILQIHLDSGDALLGAGHLEVHFAVEVLHALNVDKRGETAVIVLNKTAGNAGHRSLDGHTGIH